MARSTKVHLNNPALLRWARESAGYELDDVGRAVGRPAEIVAAWEVGAEVPTYRQLQKLARKVRRPVAVLYLPEIPAVPPPPEDFRTLPGAVCGSYAPESLLAFRELRNNMRLLRELLDEMQEPLRLNLPEWSGLSASAAARASQLREWLGVTFEQQLAWDDENQALNDWRDVLFDRGVLVQVLPIPLADARAFSEIAYDLGGVGLSSEDAPLAKPFSLIHEVVHLALRRPGVSGEGGVASGPPGSSPNAELERYCSAVAADLLLPPDDPAVAEALERLSPDLPLSVAQYYAGKFKVSKYVIARRLFDLELVPRERYWDIKEDWEQQDAEAAAKARARRRERDGWPDPVRVRVSHAGKRYVAKVFEALTRGVITAHEASGMVSIKPDALDKAYGMLS